MPTEQEYQTIIYDNPGDPVFADYSAWLLEQHRMRDAVDICLRGLSSNPECHKGRLVLAQAFFRLGFIPFAVREIEHLSYFLPENEALRKLLVKLDPISAAPGGDFSEGSEQVADIEFDLETLQALDAGKKI